MPELNPYLNQILFRDWFTFLPNLKTGRNAGGRYYSLSRLIKILKIYNYFPIPFS